MTGLKIYRAAIVSICLVLTGLMVAQSQSNDVWHISFDNEDLSSALTKLSVLSETNIIFSPDQIGERTITVSLSGTTDEILRKLLDETGVRFKERNSQYILYVPRRKEAKYFIRGYVEDEETGERLISAHVLETESGTGTSTNAYGYFSLHVPVKTAQLHVSYLGFETDMTRVESGDNVVNIRLKKSLTLKEVVIYSEKKDRFNVVSLDGQKIKPDQIESAAGLGGEFDLHQYAVQLPGVTTGTDGIGGVNIRGGSNDQNLVLMDGVPVYNPTHTIGILSVFNPHVINDAELTTGSFSARYGGRLSSVMDVHTKEGSNRKWGFTGGIGTLSANAMIEGPLVQDKVTLLIAGRIFTPQTVLRKLSIQDKENNGLKGFTNYTFNDLNIKLNVVLSSRDRIYVSYYRGQDTYKDVTEQSTFTDEMRLFETYDKSLEWGNSIGMLRWNHELGERTFSNLTLTSSKFSLQSLDKVDFRATILDDPRYTIDGFVNREFKSQIDDLSVKWDISHMIGTKHNLKFGVSATQHHFKPKSIAFDDQAEINGFVIDEGTIDDALFADLFVKAGEFGLYIEDDAQLTPKLNLNGGLRISAFNNGDKTYFNPEPRLKLTYSVSEKISLELAASRMVQYVHLLTSSGIGLPTDLWVPSSELVKPQTAGQISTGAIWQPKSYLSLSWQLFYKRMHNLTQYKEGASFLLKEGAVEAGIIDVANWEDKVVQGEGVAFGSEWQAKVHFQKWSASANYTLSKSERKFDKLNFGDPFPFKFDRRHNVSTSGSYHFNDVITATANWTYGSGAPITLAESKFLYPGSGILPLSILEIGERNGYRLPAYHRLDLGVSATWHRPKAQHTLNFSLYNVYGRRNLLYVTVTRDSESQVFENRQFSVLPFIPSLSYQIRL